MAVKKKAKSTEKKYVTDSSIPIKQFYVKSTKKKTKEEEINRSSGDLFLEFSR